MAGRFGDVFCVPKSRVLGRLEAWQMEKTQVIFDTDLGEDIDDLYALCLAVVHPQLDVQAITTVHGDTQAKARLAKKVLRPIGRPDIPVGAGISMSEARIARKQVLPDPTHSATYIDFVTPDDPEFGTESLAATDVIVSVLREFRSPTSFIVAGAFSNVAQALTQVPDSYRGRIASVASMAGETYALHSEYNVLCDPEAADYVFNSGLPVFMGTFHLTARLKATMEDVRRQCCGRSPLHEVLLACTETWFSRIGASLPGPVLYDLVPVYWAVDHDWIETRSSTVRVELEGAYTRGQTVRFDGGPVLESTDLDAEKMVKEFFDLIDRPFREMVQ